MTVLDPTKTICAPYFQDNAQLFGLNAGRQRVAMSLCALIYNQRNPITSAQLLSKHEYCNTVAIVIG